MERNPSTSSGQAIWQTSQNPGGTPGQPNSKPSGQQETTKPLATSTNLTNKEIPVPISSSATTSQNEQKPPITNSADRPDLLQKIIPSNIFLNEIMPSPEGSDSENEWIELYNANNFEADISGWKIRDKIGAVKTYAFPENTKIEANSFLILKRPQIKISLNNEGDGLELLNPNGKIIDSIDYEKAKQGQSWSKTENDWPAESPAGNQAGWQWTAKPTPGAANVIVKTTTQAIAKTLPTSSQNEKLLLAQAGTPSAGSGQGAAPKNKNILAVVIAALLADGSAVIAWQIKKKSTEI